eukprot:975873_1
MSHQLTWKFELLTQDYRTFKLSRDKPDTCIEGERQIFEYSKKRISYYWQCTPSGFSSSQVPRGACVLWCAIPSGYLPPDIAGIDVKCTVICQAVRYKQQSSCHALGLRTWSFPIGPPYISFDALYQQTSWQFDLLVEITNIIPRNYANTSVSPTVALSNNARYIANLVSQQLQHMSSQFTTSQNSLVQSLIESGVKPNDAMQIVSMSKCESSTNKAIEFTGPANTSLGVLLSLGFSEDFASIELGLNHQDVKTTVALLVEQQLLRSPATQVCDDSKTIKNCGYLHDLKWIMEQYDDSKDDMYDHIYTKFNYVQIIDIFHHFKRNHDEDEHFEHIYNMLPKCNMKYCDKLRRHYRDRCTSIANESRLRPHHSDPPMQEILDKIHCYYKHSFDGGYRFTSDEINKVQTERKEEDIRDDEKGDGNPWVTDLEIQSLQSIQQHKKKNFALETNINNVSDKFSELQDAYGQLDGGEYKIGEAIYYEDIDMHVKANVVRHYKNLEYEMINNNIASISKGNFDKTCANAVCHLNTKFYRENSNYFQIKCPFTQIIVDISAEHLLSVIDGFLHLMMSGWRLRTRE